MPTNSQYHSNIDYWREMARLDAQKRRDDNPEHYRQIGKRCRELQRDRALALYGSKCAVCGFTDKRALQFDHKFRPYGAYSKKNHIHGPVLCSALLRGIANKEDYQVLCANCNWIKRHDNHEVTPRCKLKVPQENLIS